MALKYLLAFNRRYGDPVLFYSALPMNPFDKEDWRVSMRWASVDSISRKTNRSCKEIMHNFVLFKHSEKCPHASLLGLWRRREYFGALVERYCGCKNCGLQTASTACLWDLEYFERVLLPQPKKYDYFFEHYLLPEKWVLYFLKTQTT